MLSASVSVVRDVELCYYYFNPVSSEEVELRLTHIILRCLGQIMTMSRTKTRKCNLSVDAHVSNGDFFLKKATSTSTPSSKTSSLRTTASNFPRPGIEEWNEMFYLLSRGIDLGTFGGAILSSAFKEQSIKWASMTQAYRSHVIVVVLRFLVIALNMFFTNVHVREEMCNSSKTSGLRHSMPCNEVPEVAYLYRYLPVSARGNTRMWADSCLFRCHKIWSFMLDEVLKRYKAATIQAIFLESTEREKAIYHELLLQRETFDCPYKSEDGHVESKISRRDQERL
jgi:hypothetical protein